MTLTLRARLALIATVIVGALLALLGSVSYRVLAARLDADATQRLDELTEGLHGYLAFGGDTPSVRFDPNDSDETAFVHEATRYYQVYDAATGRLLVQSPGFAPLGAQLTADEVREAADLVSGHVDLQTEYGRIRISSSVVRDRTGRAYLLQVGFSLVQTDRAVARYRAVLWWSAVPALLAAALSSWWLSRLALAPLREMSAAAAAIDMRALHARLPVRGAGDEMDALAGSFNAALDRLETAVAEMRQFSASLAHELRTPLAAMRGEAELALRGRAAPPGLEAVFASQIEEIDRLSRLIEQILTLARAESGQIPLAFEPVDVSGLAAAVVEQIEPVAQSRGLELRVEAARDASVSGDEGWLRRLLLNLLDNALKFTPAGGWVCVRTSRGGGQVAIEVVDSGVGMTAEVAARAFDRFYRGDAARPPGVEGAGLGLSLARWIAERHGGTIEAASRPGEGATVRVTLPAA